VAVLVDDGLATGASMRAAVTAVRQLQPKRVVVAVPVGAPETVRDLEAMADEVVCVSTPDPFWAVGRWYADFDQTTDDEVRALLKASRAG
jgi:predicted phosphoribosyltransferase